jgi:hypothetical protein
MAAGELQVSLCLAISAFTDAAFIGAIPLRAAWLKLHQPLPPVHQRILAASHPIELLWDKPRPSPTVRFHGGNSLVVNWRSADPVVSQPDDPCPRTASLAGRGCDPEQAESVCSSPTRESVPRPPGPSTCPPFLPSILLRLRRPPANILVKLGTAVAPSWSSRRRDQTHA